MTKSKEILSHTADIKIRITSETLPELFQLSLGSLNQLLSPNFNIESSQNSITQEIDLKSPDTTSLLIDFLSEVLTYSQINKAIFSNFNIDRMTDCTLKGTLTGGRVQAFNEDVKAVTYHEADVSVNEEGNWETIIIFDI